MTFQKTWQQTLTDIKVKVASEFDKNFERKAFFNRAWRPAVFSSGVGSLLVRSGKLRRSITSRVQGNFGHKKSRLLNLYFNKRDYFFNNDFFLLKNIGNF